MKLIERVSLLVAGAVLVFSGILHAVQPIYFANSIANYGIVPHSWLLVIVFFLPYIQIVVGAVLSLKPMMREPRWFALALFCVFVAFQAKILIGGERISCGCFGMRSDEVSYKTIAVPLCLAVALAYTLVAARSPAQTEEVV